MSTQASSRSRSQSRRSNGDNGAARAGTTIAAPAPAIACFDPATGEVLGEAPVVSPAELTGRVRRARTAQRIWARTSFAERRAVLARLLEHLLDHTDELCRVISRDAGKTLENALLGEIWPVCEKLRHTLATGEEDLRDEPVSSGLFVHKRARIEYHPLGVIGVICPWNYPLQNVMAPTVPALFAGNAVIVKVSEWTSWSATHFQAIFDRALARSGFPLDLVQVITGDGETGAALCRSGVDKVVFTGSMDNGRRVMAACAETLTPVILELGGKDPLVVCDDADLEQAVHGALAGVYITSGQSCLAAERILVHEAIYQRFVERVVEAVRALRQGPPLEGREVDGSLAAGAEPVDVGAMTTPRQLELVEALVADAVARGARVRAGGHRQPGPGLFHAPTVVGSSRVDLQACKLEYSIVSPK